MSYEAGFGGHPLHAVEREDCGRSKGELTPPHVNVLAAKISDWAIVLPCSRKRLDGENTLELGSLGAAVVA